MKNLLPFLAPLVVVALATPAQAAVTDSRENGFTIETTVLAEASPAVVYGRLTKIAGWWDPKHTWSGSAGNLRLEPKAGGCFCEKLSDGGSVQHGRVIFAQPGKLLRLDA